jgi:hypothetical protein
MLLELFCFYYELAEQDKLKCNQFRLLGNSLQSFPNRIQNIHIDGFADQN